MRKVLIFALAASIFLASGQVASGAEPRSSFNLLSASATSVSVDDGYFSDSFAWSDGRISQLFVVSRPEGCPGAGVGELRCAIWISDATGEHIVSGWHLSPGVNKLLIRLNKPLKDILGLGPVTATIGTYSHISTKDYGPIPPDDFVLAKTFQITAASTITSKTCNPFTEDLEGVQDAMKRQELIEDVIFDGDGSRNKPIIDKLRKGKRLNGVTQIVTTKEVKLGLATAVSDWMTGEFPANGYYFRAYDNVRFRLYHFDCSKQYTVRYQTYAPFRFGKDGIAMDFSTLGRYQPTNEWLTVGGKTYQTLRSEKLVAYKSGPIKSCKSLVRGSFDYSSCFIPSKPGTYNVTVKQQYIGSGNLIITCRGNIYSINCSSSRDKSVSRTLSGKFTIDSNGVVQGPGWWTHDYD